jgi:hypothetical protein
MSDNPTPGHDAPALLGHRHTAEMAANALANAFPWHLTHEGVEFWTAVHQRLWDIGAGKLRLAVQS